MKTQHNTIGKGSSKRGVNGGNDAYFTNPAISARLVDFVVSRYVGTTFVEPSAGDGSFLSPLLATGRKVIAYDLFPKAEGIIKADWFTVNVADSCVVIGNPPFGFAANLAIRFFNHAATKAKAIAFIVPRSFQKKSVQRRLNPHFHLVHEEVLPDNAFILDGAPYSVPCVFQIWERDNVPRDLSADTVENPYLEFTTRDAANISIRRVGGRAGEILDGTTHNQNTTFFAKTLHKDSVKALVAIQSSIRILREQTAGVRSISKREICALLNAYAAGKSK